jgi:Undecaprenyl-phosphate galactose phosphotransferase WbaP
LPLILFLALLIKLDSPGPVFFVQKRLGKDRSVFPCIKFRTMYVNGDEMLKEYFAKHPEREKEYREYRKLKEGDPRITKVGAFLRKTSLDELPQIFNVLKGDMSLIGPRPYMVEEWEQIKDFAPTILLARPGITGLWQVSGRSNLQFEDRIRLDSWYVLNWSLWLDFIILLKTVKVVLKMEGAY